MPRSAKTWEDYYSEATEAVSVQDYSRAAKLLEKSARLAPDEPVVHEALALCYSLLGQNNRAIEAYKKAIELAPETTKYYYYIARLYIEEGKQVEASAIIEHGKKLCREQLLERPSDLMVIKDLARLYSIQNLHDDSILTIMKGLRVNNKDPELFRMLAQEYYALEMYREAIAESETALALGEHDANTYLYMGLSYHKLNITGEALRFFNLSLNLDREQKELHELIQKLTELKKENGPTVEELIYEARSKSLPRLKGKVKWFNEEQGIGFLEDEAGRDYFIHYLAIEKEGYQTVYESSEVEFSVIDTAQGSIAVNIKEINQDPTHYFRGKVKRFDREKGIGEIENERGESIFVHYTGIIGSGVRELIENSDVIYEVFETENGPQAFNVRYYSSSSTGKEAASRTENSHGSDSQIIHPGEETGTIKFYDRKKGLGIIDSSKGYQVFFNKASFEKAAFTKAGLELQPGVRVVFKLIETESLSDEKAFRAFDIRPLQS